jgi:hypothetical protein
MHQSTVTSKRGVYTLPATAELRGATGIHYYATSSSFLARKNRFSASANTSA